MPDTKFDDEKKLIFLDIDVDEGKQFFVRRIEFEGNTTTRDKVIRREIALEEGQVYNQQLWEVSLLRLNQFGYFEQLKPDDQNVTERRLDEKAGTVDLVLKVERKRKEQCRPAGRRQRACWSFHRPELHHQQFPRAWRNPAGSGQHRKPAARPLFGFTEPYLYGRPCSWGSPYIRASTVTIRPAIRSLLRPETRPLDPATAKFAELFAVEHWVLTLVQLPLRRSFKRVGIVYSYDRSSLVAVSDASKALFTNLAFRGIRARIHFPASSRAKSFPASPSIHWTQPMRPTAERAFFSGPSLPAWEARSTSFVRSCSISSSSRCRKAERDRLQRASFVSRRLRWCSRAPFERFYLGGDNDLRGFDIRSISPIAFLPDRNGRDVDKSGWLASSAEPE